jgi:crossover junction endodeoxyribonuclease RuvC
VIRGADCIEGRSPHNESLVCPEEIDQCDLEDECFDDCDIPSCMCDVESGSESHSHSRSGAGGQTILGIDPGLSVTGYAILRKEKGQTQLLDFGALPLSPKDTVPHRVAQFHAFFNDKIVQWGVKTIALETPFMGKNAQNFLKLGYLRGIVYLLSQQHAVRVCEFAPREIKMTVTGYGAADKDQVARVVTRLFQGLQMPKKLDITDALAVALCGLWKETSFYSLQQTT